MQARTLTLLLTSLGGFFFCQCLLLAQATNRPAYKQLRYDEDYSFLRDPALRTDFFDPIKYISIYAESETFLSLGGEARERYEYFQNPVWGRALQDEDGYWLQRYLLHADLQAWNWFRTFVQLQSSIVNDRRGGPRTTDEDLLEVHQAFADLSFQGAPEKVTLRLGRQEVAYGSSRLISFREGPNNRLSFDGVRALARFDAFQVDVFALKPVETKPGVFDDGPDPGQTLWGIYSTHPLPFLGLQTDLYYIGLERDNARFVQGSARELRHTFGTRLFGNFNNFDYNFEGVFQGGTFGNGSIWAWTLASDQGYTFEYLPWQPRLGLKANITSGDKNAADEDLNTFNPLFPKGSYFGEPALIGPANHIDVHPALDLKPSKTLTLSFDWDFFWRQTAADGIYGPAVNVLVTPQGSRARYVGDQLQALAEWRPSRHWAVTAVYARFFAGEFLKETTPGKDVDYASLWLTFKF